MVRGSCLCGGIRFEADEIPLLTLCHCSKCRKTHGAPFRAAAFAALDAFRFVSGENLIQHYAAPPSGYPSAFCRVCGSSAPRIEASRQLVSIPAGLLDDDPGVRPALHIFTGSRAPWWEITDGAPQFDEWVPGHEPHEQG